MEIDTTTGVTPADRVKEDDPTVWLPFDLDIGLVHVLGIMCSQDDPKPICQINENGHLRRPEFGHEMLFNLKREEIGVIGGDYDFVIAHMSLQSNASDLGAIYIASKIGAMKKSIYTSESVELREILRETRRKADLSQRGLAAKLAVSPSWVAKVETGERRIDLIEFGWFVSACGSDVAAAFQAVAKMFPAARVSKGGRPA